MGMDNLDLLNRTLSNIYSELRAHADLCADPNEKSYCQGRVAGIEVAIAVINAWRSEAALPLDFSGIEETPISGGVYNKQSR